MVILLTGVGARLLNQIHRDALAAGTFIDALAAHRGGGARIEAGGRDAGMGCAGRDLRARAEHLARDPEAPRRAGRRTIAVQEYGRTSAELMEGLRARGAEVTTVPVYQWDLPRDIGPLREAVRRLAPGSSTWCCLPLRSRWSICCGSRRRRDWKRRFAGLCNAMVIASVGPTTSETLRGIGHRAGFRAVASEDGVSGERDRARRPQQISTIEAVK